MSFGEMIITLDDMTSLLHIPVTGTFFTLPNLTQDDVVVLDNVLRVAHAEAEDEICSYNGSYERYTWLDKIAHDMVKDKKREKAARAFLLQLVGMTIFSWKTNKKGEVAYLKLFHDLDAFKKYAWGAISLAYPCEHLKEASKNSCTSIGDYLNLFQICDKLIL